MFRVIILSSPLGSFPTCLTIDIFYVGIFLENFSVEIYIYFREITIWNIKIHDTQSNLIVWNNYYYYHYYNYLIIFFIFCLLVNYVINGREHAAVWLQM